MKFEKKYAPKNLSEFVFSTATAKNKVGLFIENNMDGHLLLHGKYGSGKTTLSKLIPLEVARLSDPNCDKVWFQHLAGQEITIQSLSQIKTDAGFAHLQLPKQLIVIDEADLMANKAGQAMKKMIDDTERYCAFIFCTNHVEKIDAGIRSRCIDISFDKSDVTALTNRAKFILAAEGVKLPDDALKPILEKSRGDFRKLLQDLEDICFAFRQKHAA